MSYPESQPFQSNTGNATLRTPQFGAPARPRPSAMPPVLRSEDLFRGGNNELLIEHRGECYRLRLTRQDKLILNK